MAEMSLSYNTHRLILKQDDNCSFTQITNYVLGDTYQEMLDSIIFDKDKAFNFVYNERILLNNFLLSLVDFHNREFKHLAKLFYAFKNEDEYYIFCVINNLEFKEQTWFKTAFIQDNIYAAYVAIQQASIKLISTLYPENYSPPESLLKRWFEDIKTNRQNYKCSPEEYKHFLEQNNIEAIYHFTSYKNVESIKQHGICSISYLKELGVHVDYASTSKSQYIDKMKGLEDYIHLGFEKRHPMLMNALAKGVLSSYKVYEVSSSVLFLKDTMYTNKNAIKGGAQISSDIDFLLNIPFHRFHNKNFFSLSLADKDYFQSEILVKHNIPNNLILN